MFNKAVFLTRPHPELPTHLLLGPYVEPLRDALRRRQGTQLADFSNILLTKTLAFPVSNRLR